MDSTTATLSQTPTRRISTEQRRREILDGALSCFLENGVLGTTIEQIRKASNASHGSIYHLFRSKDEIALTLFVEGMRIYHGKMLAALAQETSAQGAVRVLIATHLRDIAENPLMAVYLTRLGMTEDLGEISAQYRLLNDEFMQSICKHLRPYVERGELVRLPDEIYFSLIIGPSAHLSRNWLQGRIQYDLMSAADDLGEAAWRSLRQ